MYFHKVVLGIALFGVMIGVVSYVVMAGTGTEGHNDVGQRGSKFGQVWYRSHPESSEASEVGVRSKLLFDTWQLVVLGHPLASARAPDLS
jgi:hypothetical protein